MKQGGKDIASLRNSHRTQTHSSRTLSSRSLLLHIIISRHEKCRNLKWPFTSLGNFFLCQKKIGLTGCSLAMGSSEKQSYNLRITVNKGSCSSLNVLDIWALCLKPLLQVYRQRTSEIPLASNLWQVNKNGWQRDIKIELKQVVVNSFFHLRGLMKSLNY